MNTIPAKFETIESHNFFQALGIPGNAKWSFVTRNVPAEEILGADMISDRMPRAGDLILARVEKMGQHKRLQLRCGRRAQLYPDDQVVLAYGNRYAPDQFEAVVPENLDLCHMVAAGGIAARALSKHTKLRWPTTLRPEGFCINPQGKPVNLRDYALEPTRPVAEQQPVIAVLGTSMNSGKTTTATSIIKGMTSAGYRVAAIKATGTGAGNDLWCYRDAGAHRILDFTDAGYPSTYLVPRAEILACFNRLLSAAYSDREIDLIVVEIADGLLHFETADLVASEAFQNQVDHVLFAAGEAMGAVAGVERLHNAGVKPIALSGLLSTSGLASAEAEYETSVPVLTKAKLEHPSISRLLDA